MCRADVDSRDQWKCTGLHRACQQGNLGLAELLLEKGASLVASDDRGERPGQSFDPGVKE
ncbi:unnamed protein product, partial [Discosporangium mesarthrocarpum]